jgi:hypothetical protein
MSIQVSIPARRESRAPKEMPIQPEVNRLFYFEDSQVVLQVSHCITGSLSTLLTIPSYTGGRTEVQNPSLFPDSGIRIFQRFILAPPTGGLHKCRGFRQ